MTTAAPTPANATTPIAARTAVDVSDVAAAVDASGIRAAVSIRPSMKSERQTGATPARPPLARRTTATRTTSSKRPGRAAPVTDAAPHEAASVKGFGRSSGAKRRCQPYALNAYARRKRRPVAATSRMSAPANGQPIPAKWRAASTDTVIANAPTARFSASFPRGERHTLISPLIECLIGHRRDDLNPRSGYARRTAWGEDSALARVPVRGIVGTTARAYRQNWKGVAAWP
jgi:hypothetical protein